MNTDRFKSTLQTMKEDVQERLGRIDQHIHHHDGAVSQDFGEQSIERQNDDVVNSLDGVLNEELQAINAALNRIERGVFGTCVDCGAAIDEKRLRAIPHAAVCTHCMSDA